MKKKSSKQVDMKTVRIHLTQILVLLTVVLCLGSEAFASPATLTPWFGELTVPILGVTLNEQRQPVGVVTEVVINFRERADHHGLQVQFLKTPGQFSPIAQKAVEQAITRVSQAAHLRTDSWTIQLTFPYPGVTMFGDSLSAMVGLSVVALAKGDHIFQGRSITGTITENGTIGKVGGVPLKINAAYSEHLYRVFIPEEQEIADGDWKTPFLMHVSPVESLDKAYFGLTGQHLLVAQAVQ